MGVLSLGAPRLGALGLRSESGIGGLILEIWQRRHRKWGAVFENLRAKCWGLWAQG